jgi:hypothetical protein
MGVAAKVKHCRQALRLEGDAILRSNPALLNEKTQFYRGNGGLM